MRYLTPVSLLVLLITPDIGSLSGRAGWGSSCAGPVGPSYAQPFYPQYQPAIYYSPQLWDKDEGKYYPRLGPNKWGGACQPPIQPPCPGKASCCGDSCPCQKEGNEACKKPGCGCNLNGVKPGPVTPLVGASPDVPGGVDLGKIQPGRCTINGQETSRERVMQALEGGGDQVPDTSKLLRLTLVGGTDQQRAAVLADLNGSPWKDKLVVKAVAADHWLVKQNGYVPGNPAIYVQSPAGRKLHAQKDYAGKDALFAALDTAQKSFDPATDKASMSNDKPWPDCSPRSPSPSPAPEPLIPPSLPGPLSAVPPGAWWLGIGGGVTYLILRARNKPSASPPATS